MEDGAGNADSHEHQERGILRWTRTRGGRGPVTAGPGRRKKRERGQPTPGIVRRSDTTSADASPIVSSSLYLRVPSFSTLLSPTLLTAHSIGTGRCE